MRKPGVYNPGTPCALRWVFGGFAPLLAWGPCRLPRRSHPGKPFFLGCFPQKTTNVAASAPAGKEATPLPGLLPL